MLRNFFYRLKARHRHKKNKKEKSRPKARHSMMRRFKDSYWPLILLPLMVLFFATNTFRSWYDVTVHPYIYGDEGDVISGSAYVIDGDTLKVDGKKIRLEGIDTVEKKQTCLNEHNDTWNCGKKAIWALEDEIGSETVRCIPSGTDRYKRILATCYLGKENLNEWMVRNGWAIAYRRYSMRYIIAEQEARIASRGIWIGTFKKPEDWRRRN